MKDNTIKNLTIAAESCGFVTGVIQAVLSLHRIKSLVWAEPEPELTKKERRRMAKAAKKAAKADE